MLEERDSARGGRAGFAWKAAVLSACTVAVLGIQTVAAFGKLREAWPFLDYPMYRSPHFVGDEIPQYVVVAKLASGASVDLTAQDCGLNDIKYRRGPVAALRRGDVERLRLYLAGCAAVSGARVAEVVLENHPLRLAESGFEALPSRVEARAAISG